MATKHPTGKIFPVYPITLSLLTLDNKIRTIRMRNATIEQAGETARDLSSHYEVFVNILDEENTRHGAFLHGEYIPSDTPQEEMIRLADAWQRDNGYDPETGTQDEKRAEIFIARS